MHVARHFPACPDIEGAESLLTELTSAPCLFGPVGNDRPLALYGAGNLGRMARDFLKTVWADYDFVIDREAERHRDSGDWKNRPIFVPDDVPAAMRSSHRVLVTVATAPYVEIERSLLDLGFTDIVPFYDFAESFSHIHPLSNGWFAEPVADLDLDMIRMAIASFADGRSRAHFLQFLAWRRLREEWTFDGAPVTGDDRFFLSEIIDVLGTNEEFVDGGAYHGEVSREFDRRLAGRWKSITAIEPDPESRARLEMLNGDRPLASGRKIVISGYALGSHHHSMRFHSGLGYASQLGEGGNIEVDVVPMDDLKSATFIKLHLEGGELDALKGGRQLLIDHRPLIAATVYHNDDGLWRTALWLHKTLPRYRFLFRLHSWCGTGAVIYAIPDERARR